jgi:hypothetical protein
MYLEGTAAPVIRSANPRAYLYGRRSGPSGHRERSPRHKDGDRNQKQNPNLPSLHGGNISA